MVQIYIGRAEEPLGPLILDPTPGAGLRSH